MTRQKTVEPVDLLDLSDELQKAVELGNIIIMAAASIGDRNQMNAIARVGYDVVEILKDVQQKLEGVGK